MFVKHLKVKMQINKQLLILSFVALSSLSCSKKKEDAVTPVTPTPPVVPAIGISYAGGIIFYLDSTGQHGLVAAPADQKTAAEWGCTGTLDTANASGAYNTHAIL